MRVPRFELDRWMHEYETRPPRFDLAGSTGPAWSTAEVLALGGVSPGEATRAALAYSSVDGREELRGAVGDMCGASAADVQITTGASEALVILTAAHAGRGGNIVVPDPGYPPFGALAEVFGQEVRRYSLRPEDGFRIDPESVARVVDGGTTMVIVNSPHNPTGACVTPESLAAIRDSASTVGATVVVDQVFHPIAHGAPPLSVVAGDGLVLVGDMSKALSMPGLRIGWVVDTDAERRDRYFDLRAYMTLSSGALTERIATVALTHRDRVLQRTRSTAARNLEALGALIARRGDRLAWVAPVGGLVAFPWLRGQADARPFCRALAGEGVLLAPGDCFGHPGHFRLGFGASPPERFAAAMAVLYDSLETGP